MTLREVAIVAGFTVVGGWLASPIAQPPKNDEAVVTQMAALGRAFLVYQADVDGKFPLQGVRPASLGLSSRPTVSVPAGWPPDMSDERAALERTVWANSILPYLADPKVLGIEGAPEIKRGAWDYDHPKRSPIAVAMTFNGLLSEYAKSAVASPDTLPLVWTGNGRINQLGYAHSSPALNCDSLPPEGPCLYAPQDQNLRGMLMLFQGSAFAFPYGMYFVTVDGSVTHIAPGSTEAFTDFRWDPFAKYDANNKPISFWSDGRFPWLFRPDRS